ncbi:MAG: Asp-tRNA(Asn)/Glu-tRNA(Gln) amidotransferase GatCAB subunit C, partial [Bacteroidetes bacterium]
LELSTAERQTIQGDLNNILKMVEQLQSLELEGVEPLVYVNVTENRLRADLVKGQVSREEALRNAPDTDGVFFRVPKVIDL